MGASPRRRRSSLGPSGAVGVRACPHGSIPDGAHERLDRSDRAVRPDADCASLPAGRYRTADDPDRPGGHGGLAAHASHASGDAARRRRRCHRWTRDGGAHRLAQPSGTAHGDRRPPIGFLRRDRLPVDRLSRCAGGGCDRCLTDDDGAVAQDRLERRGSHCARSRRSP